MITTVTGKNAYALKAALKSTVGLAYKELGDMGIEKIDAQEADADTILQAVQSLPFLVPRKLVIVQNAQSNTELMNRIEEVIDRAADEVDVLLVGPSFDKRKSYFNILKKHTTLQEYNELKQFELPDFLVKEATKLGVTITKADAGYLVDRVGPDQMVLVSEIRKIAITTDTITRQGIDLHTEKSPQSNIFDMLDAAFSGNSKRAIELYREQRKMRVEPQYIIAMLTWQLNNLALAVFASPQSESTLTAAGQSPYAARKSLNLAKSTSKEAVKRYIADLTRVDVDIKTSAEADSALELYLLSLSS